MILCFLIKLKKTVTLVALRMVFVEVFLAFSAIAALLIGISVGRLWTSESNTAELRIQFDGTIDVSQTADEAGPRNLLVVSQPSLKNGYLLSIFRYVRA